MSEIKNTLNEINRISHKEKKCELEVIAIKTIQINTERKVTEKENELSISEHLVTPQS